MNLEWATSPRPSCTPQCGRGLLPMRPRFGCRIDVALGTTKTDTPCDPVGKSAVSLVFDTILLTRNFRTVKKLTRISDCCGEVLFSPSPRPVRKVAPFSPKKSPPSTQLAWFVFAKCFLSGSQNGGGHEHSVCQLKRLAGNRNERSSLVGAFRPHRGRTRQPRASASRRPGLASANHFLKAQRAVTLFSKRVAARWAFQIR